MILFRLASAASTAAPKSSNTSITPQRPRFAAVGWGALGLFMAGVGQLYFQLGLPRLDGFLFYGVAAVAFWRLVNYLPAPDAFPIAAGARRTAARKLPAITLCLFAIVLSGLAVMNLGNPPRFLPPQALTLGAAFLWISTGIALDGWAATVRSFGGWLSSVSRHDAAILAGIVLCAALLRFVALSSLPFGLWFDEANIGLEAQEILGNTTYRPIYAPSTTSPAAFVYLVAAAEALFQQTVFAVRAVPALSGVLSTFLAYLVGRALFGPRAGLMAAALYAVARWDINFSRLGMQGATTPLLTLTVAGLAAAAVASGRLAVYAALGVALGGMFWFYTANYVFPIVLALGFGALVVRDRALVRQHRNGLAVMLIGCALVVVPLLAYVVNQPKEFLNRTQMASLFRDKSFADSLPVALESVGKHLLMLHVDGDRNGRHNLPGAPMLDWLTAIAMFIGVVASIRTWRDPRSALLLGWLFLMLLPGALSLEFEAPQGLRSIGVVPAVVLLAALGMDRMGALVFPFLAPRQRWVAGVGAAGLAFVLNAGAYFGLQANDATVWSSFSTPETLIAQRLTEGSDKSERGLVSVFYGAHPTIRYLSSVRGEALSAVDQIPLQGATATTLFMHLLEDSTYRWVTLLYPQAACQEVRRAPKAPPIYLQCTVAPSDIKATQGLLWSVSRLAADGQVTVRQGVVQSAALPVGGVEPADTVDVSGALFVPQTGVYRLQLEGPSSSFLSLDGETRARGGEGPVTVDLALGLHDLRVTGSGEGDAAQTKLVWQPPNSGWSDVPGIFLFHGNVRPMGLTGAYAPSAPGASSQTSPTVRQVEPSPSQYFHVPPVTIPFNAGWTGSIYAPISGTYRFEITAVSSARVEIDGAPIVSTRRPDAAETGAAGLGVGWHPISISYEAKEPYPKISLKWTRPDGVHEVVPPNRFRPW